MEKLILRIIEYLLLSFKEEFKKYVIQLTYITFTVYNYKYIKLK